MSKEYDRWERPLVNGPVFYEEEVKPLFITDLKKTKDEEKNEG